MSAPTGFLTTPADFECLRWQAVAGRSGAREFGVPRMGVPNQQPTQLNEDHLGHSRRTLMFPNVQTCTALVVAGRDGLAGIHLTLSSTDEELQAAAAAMAARMPSGIDRVLVLPGTFADHSRYALNTTAGAARKSVPQYIADTVGPTLDATKKFRLTLAGPADNSIPATDYLAVAVPAEDPTAPGAGSVTIYERRRPQAPEPAYGSEAGLSPIPSARFVRTG